LLQKVPEILWYNLQCIVHYEFIPEGKNVNIEIYTDIICRLGDAVRRQFPEKWRQTVCFSFMTMLQHTGWFWSGISEDKTI
jgi:hypothetical protein